MNGTFNKSVIEMRDGVLWITRGETQMFWDVGAFRPDPRTTLKEGKNYKASVVYGEENLYSGEKISFPQKINIPSPKSIFVNFR